MNQKYKWIKLKIIIRIHQINQNQLIFLKNRYKLIDE